MTLPPGLHRPIKANRRLILMRHEVVELISTILAVRIGIQRCQQRGAALHPHALVKRAALAPVCRPAEKLWVAQPLLSFCDGAAANAIQDELMPQLVQIAQLGAFPRLLTSPMAVSNAMVSALSSAPRSGSASPVMSSAVNTGFPCSSQILAAMRPATPSPLLAIAFTSDTAEA